MNQTPELHPAPIAYGEEHQMNQMIQLPTEIWTEPEKWWDWTCVVSLVNLKLPLLNI